ncbi:MAG: hypothetical protein V1743_02875 [Nanoarchaeota archaeon]
MQNFEMVFWILASLTAFGLIFLPIFFGKIMKKSFGLSYLFSGTITLIFLIAGVIIAARLKFKTDMGFELIGYFLMGFLCIVFIFIGLIFFLLKDMKQSPGKTS